VALVQKDWKKLVAYSSVSHLAIAMLGLFALNITGIKGAVMQMLNHGISTGLLFLIVGIIYERRHTRLLSDYGGLARVVPIFATMFMIAMLSSVGLPGLNGFVGEFTVLAGLAQVSGSSFQFFGGLPAFTWTVLASTAIILSALYLLWLYQKTMFGPVTHPENKDLRDLTLREAWTLMPLVVLAVWIGVYPKPFFRLIEAPVARLVNQQLAPALRASGAGVDIPEKLLPPPSTAAPAAIAHP
jgi:NADH-quinone oxidoreductase subunit M